MSLKAIAILACVIAFGWVIFNQGLLDEEIQTIKAQPISAPEFAPETEGNALFLQGRYKEAMAKYELALKGDDLESRKESLFRIARCHEGLGNESKAKATYQAFINKYPTDARAQKAREKVETLQ